MSKAILGLTNVVFTMEDSIDTIKAKLEDLVCEHDADLINVEYNGENATTTQLDDLVEEHYNLFENNGLVCFLKAILEDLDNHMRNESSLDDYDSELISEDIIDGCLIIMASARS